MVYEDLCNQPFWTLQMNPEASLLVSALKSWMLFSVPFPFQSLGWFLSVFGWPSLLNMPLPTRHNFHDYFTILVFWRTFLNSFNQYSSLSLCAFRFSGLLLQSFGTILGECAYTHYCEYTSWCILHMHHMHF